MKPENQDVRVQASNTDAEKRSFRLRQAIEAAGGVGAIHARTGLAKSTLNSYMKEGEMKIGTLEQLAVATGVRIEWLILGTGPMHDGPTGQEVVDFIGGGPNPYLKHTVVPVQPVPPTPPPANPPGNFVVIPHLDVKAAAGNGLEVFSERDRMHFALSQEWIMRNLGRKPENLAIIEAVGHSMSPTIDDGDMMIIDTSVREARSEGVYVLSTDSGLLVKRIQIGFDGSFYVVSDNPSFPKETVRGADRSDIRVVAQVLWHGQGVA